MEPLLLHVEELVEVVWASGQDDSWTSPWGGVSGMPVWEETPGQSKDTLETLYLSAGLGTSWCPPGGVAGGWREECLDLPAQAVAPNTRTRVSGRKQDETRRDIRKKKRR